MKYITFTVPCYNSESYMSRCIKSLLVCKDEVEIVIIDDGSTDRTGAIANEYAVKYPASVKVIHKRNGGHGSGVNAGLKAASGKYFKVVDSDDWLDPECLKKVLKQMKAWEKSGTEVDMVVCNYVYDHLYEGRQKTMRFCNVFESGKVQTWEETGVFHPSQYLIMHSLIYRTDILRSSGVCLPEHMFYVDNIFANQPLPFVSTIGYLNLDLYHYFLGREDQSVNETVLKSRIDQQIYVTKTIAQCLDLEEIRRQHPKLADYLVKNISVMMAISSIHLLLINSREALDKRTELWDYIRKCDSGLYKTLRYRQLSGLTNLPGKAGDYLTMAGYRMARRIYDFN